MPRITCPNCEKMLKVPDEARGAVRCPGCGQTIAVGATAGARREAPTTTNARRTRADEPLDVQPVDDRPLDVVAADDRRGERPRKKKGMRAGLVPLLVLGPLGLVALIMSPFFCAAAMFAVVFGFGVMIVALIFVFLICRRKGLQDFNETVPWFLRGGGAMIVGQVYYAIQFPRSLACWVTLEIFGLVLAIAAAVIIGAVKPLPYPGYMPTDPNAPGPAPTAQLVKVTGVLELDDALADLANDRSLDRGLEKLSRLKPEDYTDAQGAKVAQRLASTLKLNDRFGNALHVKTLGMWATPDELPVLIKVLQGDNFWMREEALKAVATFKDPSSIPAVARCFEDFGIRRQGGEALLKMSRPDREGHTIAPQIEKAILPFLKHQDINLRRDTVHLLKEFGTDNCLPALQELADKWDNFMQDSAKEALAAVKARSRR